MKIIKEFEVVGSENYRIIRIVPSLSFVIDKQSTDSFTSLDGVHYKGYRSYMIYLDFLNFSLGIGVDVSV